MEPFEVFKNYLSTFLSVPPLEWLAMVKVLKLRQLEKDSFYYKQGEPFDEVGFVVKGALYNFYTTDSGDINVKTFRCEGQPVTCYTDLLLGIPASFSCKTLEKTTLIAIKYQDLVRLYDRHKCWERMGRLSAEKLFIEKEKRELEFLSMDAKQRYESFARQNPTLLNRAPQYLIASYIGISPASLSRIRGES
jgi:CRP-like cAMP-binding protein